eukprot:4286330-Prymnesium_polylepis.1
MRSSTCTRRACCTATSSRRTSCSTTRATSSSSTLAPVRRRAARPRAPFCRRLPRVRPGVSAGLCARTARGVLLPAARLAARARATRSRASRPG